MVKATKRSPTFLTLGMPGVQTWRIENFFKCGGYNVTTWRCQSHEMSCGSCIPEDSDDFLVSHLPACKPLMNESEVGWWARNVHSFKTYEDRWDMKPRTAPGRPGHILAIQPHVVEIPLGETGAGLLQGFTDTSLHLFPPSALSALPPEFWEC